MPSKTNPPQHKPPKGPDTDGAFFISGFAAGFFAGLLLCAWLIVRLAGG